MSLVWINLIPWYTLIVIVLLCYFNGIEYTFHFIKSLELPSKNKQLDVGHITYDFFFSLAYPVPNKHTVLYCVPTPEFLPKKKSVQNWSPDRPPCPRKIPLDMPMVTENVKKIVRLSEGEMIRIPLGRW